MRNSIEPNLFWKAFLFLIFNENSLNQVKMNILGIETSCDETGIAIYDGESNKILSEALFSQLKSMLYMAGWFRN